ncbi:hypothetical protein M3603_15345 [Rummeliibacillus stabekisii]|uniref:hypothetical protein n=1 Tax=Rummeliibacillus stabekisii TaxID=241244 RepID=UPI00203E89F6|nr:hypothetical protein [Rummeliibacillus stabekisii]MCM3317993.1 hypothetical protein [Rummeliibacillus stabekisii]
MAKVKQEAITLKEETTFEKVCREVFEVSNDETARNFRLEMKLSNDTTKFLSLIANDKATAQREAASLMQKLADELFLERAFWRFSDSQDWKFVTSYRKHAKKDIKSLKSSFKLPSSFKNLKDKVVDFFFLEEEEY